MKNLNAYSMNNKRTSKFEHIDREKLMTRIYRVQMSLLKYILYFDGALKFVRFFLGEVENGASIFSQKIYAKISIESQRPSESRVYKCTLYKCSGMCQLYSRDNFMQICVQQFAHYIREMKNEEGKKGPTKQYNKCVMEQAHLHT